MIAFGSELVIERPADAIWAYAADVTRHPEWMGVEDAVAVRGTDEVGAMGRETVHFGPRRYAAEFVVTASEPGRPIAWRVTGGMPMGGEVRLELEPLGPQHTRASWSGAFGLKGIWRIAEPFMAGEIRAGEAAELMRLKQALESAGTDAADHP